MWGNKEKQPEKPVQKKPDFVVVESYKEEFVVYQRCHFTGCYSRTEYKYTSKKDAIEKAKDLQSRCDFKKRVVWPDGYEPKYPL